MELKSFEEEKQFIEQSEEKETKRPQWSNKVQSVLTLLGFIVSVGNLWRFPYLCLKNGGGAFFIPFVLSGIFLVFPIFLLETSLGQFTGAAVNRCWEACPLFKGIGYGMFLLEAVCVYYVMVVVWTMYYLGNSFVSPLPWTQCDQWWNSGYCNFLDNTTDNATTSLQRQNLTNKFSSSTEEFFENNALQISTGIEDFGNVNIPILLCLAGSWFIIFLCIMKGVKTVGKVVYVTATLPYVLLVILLIRSLMNPGAVDGVKFLVIPDLSKLRNINVWIEAALQILYSSGVIWGPLITIQGYNKFKGNCFRDAALILTLGEGTSILASFLVFSVLGSMAYDKGQTIQEVAKSGPGLSYVVYPEAISKLPLPNLWAVLFFLMLYTLALDSVFGTYEPLITAVCDSLKTAGRHRVKTVAIICTIFMIMSIPFTFQGGFYLFQLVDWYVVSFCFPVFGFIECLIFGWIYGADRFSRDIELMADRPVPVFVRICWCLITPLLFMILFVAVILLYEPPSYGDYEYPTAATTCGIILSVVPMAPIFVFALWEIRKAEGDTYLQKIKNAAKPSLNWKPCSLEHELDYKMHYDDPMGSSFFEKARRNLFGR